MKKIFFLLLVLLYSCGPNLEVKPVQPAQNYSLRTPSDASAIAYINAVGDMPAYFQDAVDARIAAFKADSTWDSMRLCLFFPPTQDMNKCLIDARACTQNATYAYNSTLTSPYPSNQAMVGNDGLLFGKTGTAYIKTNFIYPASSLNNTCWAYISPLNESVGVAGYNAGIYQGASQSMIFQKRDAGSTCYTDMYGSTVGTGRARQTGADGAAGVYIGNRQSSTNFKLWKNGTAIASTTTAQGSVPTIQLYLNAYNSSGTASGRRNKPIGAYCVYGKALTDAQVAQETADWQAFMRATYRAGDYTKEVVFHGNSHMVMWYSKFFRQLQYISAGTRTGVDWYNVAVSGQTTPNMISNAPTVVDPLYNSSLSSNVLIVWECTNDISAGASATTAYNNLVTYCQARRALGWKVIVLPPMARYYSGSTSKILATDSVVTAIRANWPSFADKFCDFPSANYFVPRSNYATDAAYVSAISTLTGNLNYFIDRTHLTENVGYCEWAIQIAPLIDSL